MFVFYSFIKDAIVHNISSLLLSVRFLISNQETNFAKIKSFVPKILSYPIQKHTNYTNIPL